MRPALLSSFPFSGSTDVGQPESARQSSYSGRAKRLCHYARRAAPPPRLKGSAARVETMVGAVVASTLEGGSKGAAA